MWTQMMTVNLPNQRKASALTISADGTQLVAGDKTGGVHLFDLQSDEWTGHNKHRWAVVDVAMSADGAAVASVARGQKRAKGKSELASWCIESSQVVVRPNRPAMAYRCPRFFNEDRRFAVKCGEIGIYDPVTGANGQSIPEQTTGDLFEISPDGSQLAFAARSGPIHIWQLGKQHDHPSATLESDNFAVVVHLAFSDDGCLLLNLDDAGTLRIHDLATGELHAATDTPFDRAVTCGWIPSLNAWVFVDDNSQLWQVTPNGESKPHGDRLFKGNVTAVTVSSTNEQLALATGSRINLFQLEPITVEG